MTPSLTLAQAHARWVQARKAYDAALEDYRQQGASYDAFQLTISPLEEAEAELLALPSAPQEPPQKRCTICKGSGQGGTCHACGQNYSKGVASAPQTVSTEGLEEAKLLVHEWCQRDGYPGGIAAIGVKALAHILAAERNVSAPPQGWQPIATAPKDGTTLLGYDASREYEPEEGLGTVEFMRWMDGAWMDPCTHTMKPSHWMPLPTPPSAPTPQEKPE